MIEIVLFAGEFSECGCTNVESIKPLMPALEQGIDVLRGVKKSDILDLFQQYSEDLIKDEAAATIEGVAFIANWLRKSNFNQLVEKNFHTIEYLEAFVGDKKRLKAQPRGIVCHWIAGNVPTLGLFSLFQSMFVGNGNILRVPQKNHDIMRALLNVFSRTIISSGLSGADLLKSVGVIYFDKADARANEELSELADARIVWGGEEAVKAITGLPRRSHCEDLVFGPKYSFVVMDADAAGRSSGDFTRAIRFLASDVILFDQAACTSPHVLFVEKGGRSVQEIGEVLAEEFRKLAKRFPKVGVDQYIMTRIINARAEHALDPSSSVICPKENDWTILIDDKLQLEEPIESRTIFLKEVDSLQDIIPLITRKVQTIGCSVDEKEKLIAFADAATLHGVARCVEFGQMHLYDNPWDGMLVMSRLVSWVTLYYGD
jgi:hypothetical protein